MIGALVGPRLKAGLMVANLVLVVGLMAAAGGLYQRTQFLELQRDEAREARDVVADAAMLDRQTFERIIEGLKVDLAAARASAAAADTVVAESERRERTLREAVAVNNRRLEELIHASKDAAIWSRQPVPPAALDGLRRAVGEATTPAGGRGAGELPGPGDPGRSVPTLSAQGASLF